MTNFKVAKGIISVFDRIEHVGKGENAGYQSGLCGRVKFEVVKI